jgi:acyl dehydratase
MAAMAVLNATTPIGHELPPISRRFSVDMFAAGGAQTIHNDAAAARAEGLPGPIAVAPAVASLIFRMMRLCFEDGWIAGGKSSITFRRPVGVDDFCVANGTVIAKEPENDGKLRIICDVWIETEHGVKAIVGTCSGLVDAA